MRRMLALSALTLGLLAVPGDAYAQDVPGPNPWVYTLTDPGQDGIIVNGVTGSTAQIFIVKDPYGAPIFSVGHVGGAGVYGDHLRVFPPGDVFNPVVDIDPAGNITVTGAATVTLNGQTLTSADIAFLHSLQGKP